MRSNQRSFRRRLYKGFEDMSYGSSEEENDKMALPIKASAAAEFLHAGKVKLPVHVGLETSLIDEVVDDIVRRAGDMGNDESFFIADLDEVARLYGLWNSVMPRVKPFYAVKVNDDPGILQTLALLGAGFDCASKNEIDRVLGLGVDPGRIAYSHPCKHASHIIHAAENGVTLTNIDNEHEVYKMQELAPTMRLLVRIQADDPDAEFRLGNKFGCDLEEAKRLVSLCHEFGLPVVGVHFHVGSGSRSWKAFHDAITRARALFDYAWNVCGIKMEMLDIGGGFFGGLEALEEFPKFCAQVNDSLDECFPVESGVRIIAEPGRFFALLPYKLCTTVIAKRVVPGQDYRPMYYISDGRYGSMTEWPTEGKGSFRVVPSSANPPEITPLPENISSIWGPSLCGTDCLLKEMVLPHLEIGDWIVFDDMGAYTLALATLFNGYPRARVVYTARSSLLARLNANLSS